MTNTITFEDLDTQALTSLAANEEIQLLRILAAGDKILLCSTYKMDGSGKNFTISVNGQDIGCDKQILAQQSDYFRALFNSSMTECERNTVTLNDVSHEIVVALVECMKTGELKISEDNAIEMTQAAVRFQILAAISSCKSYLIMSLDDTNCFSFWQLAKSLYLESLYNKAKRHILYYFTVVVNQPEFFDLDPGELAEYLSDEHLNCESEVNVLRAIDSWVRHDSCARTKHLNSLLQCFHAEDLLPSEWEEVLAHPILCSSEAGLLWVKENKEMRQFSAPWQVQHHEQKGLAKGEENKALQNPKRKHRKLPMIFLTTGGTAHRFDEKQQEFTPFTELDEAFKKSSLKMGCRVTTIGKDMYMTGGQADLGRSSSFNMDVWKYDAFEEKCSVVTKLRSPRRHHATCAGRSCLYLLGGFGKFRQKLDTFEEYDTFTDEWKNLPRCPDFFTSPQIVYCDHKIFLYSALHCMFYFDLSTSVWTKVDEWISPWLHQCEIFPCAYDTYIFEFPVSMPDLDSDTTVQEEHKCILEYGLYETRTRKLRHITTEQSLKLENNPVLANGGIYMLNHVSNDFMVLEVHGGSDIRKPRDWGIKRLGLYRPTGTGCLLASLVKYPKYRLTGVTSGC